MPYAQESDMYPLVSEWLQTFLNSRHPRANIRVFDASRRSLARLIQETGLTDHLAPEWPSWDIHVDIVGFILTERLTKLAFVECKNTPIALVHLSQLLGYSRVALPEYSFLMAPQGASDTLRTLLLVHHRLDILEYHTQAGNLPRSMVVARWDEAANQIDASDMITSDRNRLGRL